MTAAGALPRRELPFGTILGVVGIVAALLLGAVVLFQLIGPTTPCDPAHCPQAESTGDALRGMPGMVLILGSANILVAAFGVLFVRAHGRAVGAATSVVVAGTVVVIGALLALDALGRAMTASM